MSPRPATWTAILDDLKAAISESEKSVRVVADEIGLSHSALALILDGTTGEPYDRTQRKIIRWLERQQSLATPEQELFAYFLEHSEAMATFMATTTAGLSPEDKRKVALAILNGYKKLAIELGEALPPYVYELERKFVGGE